MRKLICLLCALLVFTCSPSTTLDGGETNFQTSCESDAECGSYSCICGICSVACQTNSVCSELDSGASCEQMLCGSGGVCELTCESDEQCATAGKGFRCRSGRCRETEASSVESPLGQGGETAMESTDSPDEPSARELALIPDCAGGRVGHPGGVFQIFAGQNVTLSPYCLDAYEVTVADYRACVIDGGCGEASASDLGTNSETENRPLTGLDAPAASLYCLWAKGRLPQSAELTWAARGEEHGFEYPWGNAAPELSDEPQKLCWNSSSLCDVGSFEADQTTRGVFDLAGNAQELSVLTSANPQTRYCRFGGAYDIGEGESTDLFWSGSCITIPETHRAGSLGFRCAADAIE